MLSLEQVVETEIRDLIADNKLFTALDVSNSVKQSMPNVRHRMVRDVVRGLWCSLIETSGYGRTPISVTLPDGSCADAMLYHPLSDSWDLDAKYDAQQRSQHAVAPQQVVVNVQPVAVPIPVPQVVVAPTPQPAPVVAPMTTKDLWDNLFASQPSLFSR